MRLCLKLAVIATCFFLLGKAPVFGSSPPTLSSPDNSSTVTSAALRWQSSFPDLYPTNPFRVQVDDDPSFTSLNRDYYTKNTYYSPTLSSGLWYWRVRARDSSNNWSDWSAPWNFTLSEALPSETPVPTTLPTSSPTPAPTTLPTPTPLPSPATSGIVISNVPSSLNSDQEFEVAVQITNFSPSSHYFLKGAFVKSGSSNYFGKTFVSGQWIKNNSTYSSQLPATTDTSGNWNGTLRVMVDEGDSGFTGSDSYTFKVGLYSDHGSGPTWSNSVQIEIREVTVSLESSLSDNLLAPSSALPTTKASVTSPAAKIILGSLPNTKPIKLLPRFESVSSLAAVLGTASSSQTPVKVYSEQRLNIPLVAGSVILLLSILSLVYIRKNR